MTGHCTACSEPLSQEPAFGQFHVRCIERLLRKVKADK